MIENRTTRALRLAFPARALATGGSLVIGLVPLPQFHHSIPIGGAPRVVLAGPAMEHRDGWSKILADDLEHHVRYLASSELAGRGTGEPGVERAEEYIAAAFAETGLTPPPGYSSHFLSFPLYTIGFDRDSTELAFEIDGQETSITLGVDYRPFDFTDTGDFDAPLVFAGYGITAPEHGYDDYATLDVAGKAVLVLRHEPLEMAASSPFEGAENSKHAFFTRKAENAREHGAVAMILVTDPMHHEPADDFRLDGPLFLEADDARLQKEGADFAAGLDSTSLLSFHISQPQAERILSSAGHHLLEVQRRIDATLAPFPVDLGSIRAHGRVRFDDSLQVVPARNVAGFLEGSDPVLKEEWIVIGGHHDHLGAFSGEGDTIYNGADDNASGTAGVLQLARAFAQSPVRPRRSLLFVTFTAEERGLLGSEAFVAQRQVDIDRIAFLLNMDMIGRNPDRPLQLMGDGFSRGMDRIIEESDRGVGAGVALGGREFNGNSDHTAFFNRGIPFLTFFSGYHDDYHELSDHPELLDYERMEKIVRFAYGVVSRVAERSERLAFVHDVTWLGVQVEPSLDVVPSGEPREAAIVTHVEKRSRAEIAGIKEGDAVVAVDSVAVTNPRTAGIQLQTAKPGSRVDIELLREGEPVGVAVDRARMGYLGVSPMPLDQDRRRALGLRDNEGVAVEEVTPDGPAGKAGLLSGDILIELGGFAVDEGSLRGRLAQIGAGEVVEAVILREGARQTMQITIGERPRRS